MTNSDNVDTSTKGETTPTTVRSDNTGWWIAAIVAILAAVGLMFVFTSQNRQDDLQAARQQGAAQASLDAATVDAQRASAQAGIAAQAAADSTARASQRAAEAAQHAANQTAQAAQSAGQNAPQTAGDAARDASTTEPAPQQ